MEALLSAHFVIEEPTDAAIPETLRSAEAFRRALLQTACPSRCQQLLERARLCAQTWLSVEDDILASMDDATHVGEPR